MNISNRKITFTFPIAEGFMAKGWGATEKYNTIEIEVGFASGGMNYFSSETTSRGFYLYFLPCNMEQRNGYTSRSTLIGTGAKQILKGAERYSAKTLKELATKVQPIAKEIALAYIAGNKETVMAHVNSIAQVTA